MPSAAPTDLPIVLAIDDEPDVLSSTLQLGLGDRAQGEVLHPRDVQLQHLRDADLVLVDYLLTDWPERDGVGLALRPANGLPLAVILREQVDQLGQERLTAFALHTGHLDAVRGRLPATAGEHVIARLNNIEWAFSKSMGGRWDQMVILASAIRQLPRKWPEGDHAAAETEAFKLLDLSEDATWFDRARRNVRECQPPIHDLSGGAHGLLFVRWLLHQIMPYPCFLWREEWVAARLRITTPSLQKVLQEGGQLSKDLDAMAYCGLLAGFSGRRWWRSALEEYVWERTQGKSIDIDTLHKALGERTTVELEPVNSDAAVVCLGSDFLPTGEFIAPDQALRLRLDQWPPFADDAWTSIKRAREDRFLAAVVDPIDSNRLGEAGAGE